MMYSTMLWYKPIRSYNGPIRKNRWFKNNKTVKVTTRYRIIVKISQSSQSTQNNALSLAKQVESKSNEAVTSYSYNKFT
jgi:hypothetical protein